MTYDIYRYIYIGAAILCGVMLVASILIFILMKIPRIISDLSGATAKKAIKEIREQNERTGDKSYQVSQVNRNRGKLTDKISPSGNIIQQSQAQMGYGLQTTKIATQQLSVENANETTVLANETTVLTTSASETTVLTPNETTVLSEFGINEPDSSTQSVFAIEYEITYIHTQEIIGMGAAL